ncbi:hypothetical protein H4R20_003487 [Coemansia guatemalensis]|uniref:AB hydrolase-1 domain-containing protein n=1 Tax=Coemansia guatemalensis TaxID=2761395 RepID=A0A9W8I0G9_9FUNG|nr:hypothetical protein H4R20_003487 [Coemansia guatemalensis]
MRVTQNDNMAQGTVEVHELDRQDVESYFIPGGKVFERFFDCPLDHLQPSDERRLRIFARHIVPLGKEDKMHELPFILYLQGGPGFECRLPASVKSGWYRTAIDEGYQILLLDQRGTGLSSPINSSTLDQHFTTADKVEYVTHFRADDIVRDCEHIRNVLCRGRTDKASRKITLLGQSFGGFCIATYLSLFPDSISKALITGGIPPLVESPDTVYMATYQRMIARNKQYYATFPRDISRVRKIIEHLNKTEVSLPDGGRLSPRRFQQLGIKFGYTGGFNTLHQIVFQAASDLEMTGKLSTHTLAEITQLTSFDTNPLYCIMHESIYCQNGNASRWSAHRVREQFFADEFEHEWNKVLARKDSSAPVYFTGESVYPWMLDDYAELRKLQDVAIGLAEYTGWGQLYNTKVLASNRTPVAGIAYYNDMFVDFNFSEQTSKSIGGFHLWVSNAYLHNGISASPHVPEYLFQLLRGDITDL